MMFEILNHGLGQVQKSVIIKKTVKGNIAVMENNVFSETKFWFPFSLYQVKLVELSFDKSSN